MREVAGEYNTAKIFTDVVDDASIAQVKESVSYTHLTLPTT